MIAQLTKGVQEGRDRAGSWTLIAKKKNISRNNIERQKMKTSNAFGTDLVRIDA